MKSSTTVSSTSLSKEADLLQIKDLRQQIDQLDDQLAGLLLQRLKLSSQVQEIKLRQGQSAYTPQREAEILARLQLKYPQIPIMAIETIYQTIFSWMRPLR